MVVGFTTTYVICSYHHMLRIQILLGARCTTLCDSLLVTFGRSVVFSGFLHHNITEILLKVALNTKKSRRKEALFINNKIHCCITTEHLARWNKIMLKIITPKLYCSYLNNSFYSRRLWKESLNSDGPQFHQYLQNGQPSLILTNYIKWPWHDVGNPGIGMGKPQKCGRVKYVNGFPTPILKTRSLTAIKKKPAQIHFHSKRPYNHKNVWQHKHEEYNCRDSECFLIIGLLARKVEFVC